MSVTIQKNEGTMRLTSLVGAVLLAAACAAQVPESSSYRWTSFIQVEGQPEPVPAEWVSTPEGKFAHSIKIPNPVPKDSGYRQGMTSEQYFDHLCRNEAGEFIFKTVENILGFYFMRPPRRPTDHDLMDRFKLEAPEIERYFQLMRDTAAARSTTFIYSNVRKFKYVEEPATPLRSSAYVRAFGFSDQVNPIPVEGVQDLRSQYGVTWRGIRRQHDRELGISGGEWIVIDLRSAEVLGAMRTFGRSPRATNTPHAIWWLSAEQCPGAKGVLTAAGNAEQLYGFVSKVLIPEKDAK